MVPSFIASYDDKIQRSFVDERGVAISGLQDRHYSRSKQLCVVK
jgi:hypothetical protein